LLLLILLPQKNETVMKNDNPFVTIIIPCLNEENYIKQCLNSIFCLDYPKNKLEIIVIDNGSTDRTLDILSEYSNVIVDHWGGNIGAVRNRGAQLSKGEILAFVDGDCVVKAKWLTAAVEELKRDSVGAVGGIPLVNTKSANWVERSWVLHPVPKTEYVGRLATASFLIKKKIYFDLGGFNEDVASGEDMEFSKRIINANYKLRLLSECAVIHNGYPKTLLSLLKRQVWHASSYLKTINKNNLVFLLSHLFLISFFLFFLSILYKWYYLFLISASIIISIPLFATLFKFYKQRWRFLLTYFFGAFVVMITYYFGRAIGLTYSYFQYICRRN